MESKLWFSSDYMEGAHPRIIERLVQTNLEKTAGYGTDEYSEAARNKIRMACNCPEAEIHFLVGGTQTNATAIDAILRSYQGVIAANTGHISQHEAGAIEYGGHKVLQLPHTNGKISAAQIEECMEAYNLDDSRDHVVMPGMVYISQPTEYGTLYSLGELEAISSVCNKYDLPLYVDGARLAYALSCEDNDVTLADLAKYTDVFYIGGTKCGALFGEALVITRKGFIPHFFTIVKQHGALLAKGRLSGIQFDTLFTDGLYEELGKTAIEYANQIREALVSKGYKLHFGSPTNQVFAVINNDKLAELQQQVEYTWWEKYDDSSTVVRFATSWATTKEDVNRLIDLL